MIVRIDTFTLKFGKGRQKMVGMSDYYKQQLKKLDASLQHAYNDEPEIPQGELNLKKEQERYLPLSEGKVLLFEKDPALLEKENKKRYRNHYKRCFYESRGFYYNLTSKEEAIIVAVKAKNVHDPLTIPKKLGKYPVIGISDITIDCKFCGEGYAKASRLTFVEEPQQKKPSVFGILSFTHLEGIDSLEQLVLRQDGEEITVPASTKRLTLSMLPNARVLRLPSTLTYLGPIYAPKLEKIEIYYCGSETPECVLSVGAFSLCENLTSLSLPHGVKELPKDLLYTTENLRHLVIPAAVKDIGSGLLRRVKCLETLYVMPTELKGRTVCRAERAWIHSYAIEHFSGQIDSLTLTGAPRALPPIPVKIRELTFPAEVERISSGALSGQTELKTVTIPSTVREIGEKAFLGCKFTEIMIPDGVTKIAPYAFMNCDALTKITLPNSLTELDSLVFEGCTSLKELTLPDTLTALLFHPANAEFVVTRNPRKTVPDLRPLGKADAIDPLLYTKITATRFTAGGTALKDYQTQAKENLAKSEAAIREYLFSDEKVTVSHENLDHVTAAISYLCRIAPRGKQMLLDLCTGFTEFFETVANETEAEQEFRYANYFYDTLKVLNTCSQEDAYRILERCKMGLVDRIASSTAHGLAGEKLLAENKREESFKELIQAYRVYPRNIPVMIGIIQWFATDVELYDTKAPEKFLSLIERYQGQGGDTTDYLSRAKSMLEELRSTHQKIRHGSLSIEEKRDLYWQELNMQNAIRSMKCPAPTPIEGDWVTKELTTPKNLSTRITNFFFDELRDEVKKRPLSSFGSTRESCEAGYQRKLDAIDWTESILYPEKRAAVDAAIKKRKAAEEAERKRKEEEFQALLELARSYNSKSSSSSSYSSSSYSSSDSYSSSGYGYGEGYDDPFDHLPWTANYSYSYHNPFSPDTELGLWARAEVVGIEWDIYDRSYYTDLGIFGDHTL